MWAVLQAWRGRIDVTIAFTVHLVPKSYFHAESSSYLFVRTSGAVGRVFPTAVEYLAEFTFQFFDPLLACIVAARV